MLDMIKISKYEDVNFSISKAHYYLLNSYIPKGCPFSGYTLFNLLNDLILGCSWKITEKEISIIDFIKLLINDNNIYAVTYGPDMIDILNS